MCGFFLIQIDRMLRRLCAHYNYTHFRNVGSRCSRRGCNQRSHMHTYTHTPDILAKISNTPLCSGIQSEDEENKSGGHTHTQRKHHCHHSHHQRQLLSYHQICHRHHYHHHIYRCMFLAGIFVYSFFKELLKHILSARECTHISSFCVEYSLTATQHSWPC